MPEKELLGIPRFQTKMKPIQKELSRETVEEK